MLIATLHVTAQQTPGMKIIALFIGIALMSLLWYVSGVLDSHMEELGKQDAEATFPYLFTPADKVAEYREANNENTEEETDA